MIRIASILMALLSAAIASSTARAVDFTIDLQAHADKNTKKADAKNATPRVVLIVAAGTPITVNWVVRNADKVQAKDVLVHFFVVGQEKTNQAEVPKLTKNVMAESALVMDFKMQDKADGEITLAIARPGAYLVRVELKGAADKGQPEPFVALDLVIRGK